MTTQVDEPHPAIISEDILVLIFMHLSPEDLTLASLVCRLWSLLVRNMLWKDYGATLSQVVARLQGPNVVKAQDDDGRKLGLVEKEAWLAFNDQHAEMLRYLTLDVPLTQELCDLLKQFISDADNPGLPFPNLRALSIRPKAMNWADNAEFMSTLRYILTSPLVSFVIESHGPSQTICVDTILQELTDLAPRLRHLKVFQASSFGNFSGGFGAFKELKRLKISDITGLVLQWGLVG
ncbi:hypothetical protein FRB95_003840 [Tulasnella sp. JGI-2019a]|nr:hypothetical protein FRB95_003840 [Tulasnella sp. JGI-2019a]